MKHHFQFTEILKLFQNNSRKSSIKLYKINGWINTRKKDRIHFTFGHFVYASLGCGTPVESIYHDSVRKKDLRQKGDTGLIVEISFF